MSAIDAIKFLFSDENWQHNLLIGSVYVLIPVVGQLALFGWHCEIMQRFARKHPRPIPKLEFSDLTHYLSRGITPFVVSLILSIPLSIIITGLLFVGMFGGGVLVAAIGEPAVMIPVYLLLFVAFWAVSLTLGVLFMGAMTRAELSEEIGYSIQPGPIMSYAGKIFWKALISNFVYALLVWPIMMLGYMLCIVGFYPAMVLVAVGATHLRMQIYNVYLARGGAPIQLKPPVMLPSEQAMGGMPPGQYGQPGQYGPPGPYGPPGQYQQPGQYLQPGQYVQPGGFQQGPQGPYGGGNPPGR